MRRIAFLTDIHLDEPDPFGKKVTPKENFEFVIEDLAKRDIHEIIFGGDIGAPSAHTYFFEVIRRYPFKLMLGNHDTFHEVIDYYKPPHDTNELYYITEDEHFRHIFLDTSSDTLSDIQIEWLKKQIETDKNLVIFIHHPVLEIETPADKHFALKNRDTVKELLIDSQKQITIFSGHYHMDDYRNYKNIHQYITPSLSYQLVKDSHELKADNSTYGYRIIEIDEDKIKTQVITHTADPKD